jgi:hypothetical protein
MPLMEEPSLFREIGKTAWLATKVLVVAAVVIGLIGLLFLNHPVIGMCVFCGSVCVAQVVYYGWRDYKWKKSDWVRQRQQEERERREAQERLQRDKKSSGHSNGG